MRIPLIVKAAHPFFDGMLNSGSTVLLPLGGAGAGIIGKALLQKRNIRKGDDYEEQTQYKLWNKAPYIGALLGAVASPWWRGLAGTGYKLVKGASLKRDVTLHPHQRAAVGFIEDQRHGIVAHATGLGKTLTSIAAFENLKEKGKAKRALVVVPASLRENYAKNLKEFTNSSFSIYGPKNERTSKDLDDKSTSDYNLISYEMYKKDPEGIRERLGADTLIIDEVHRARNETSETYHKLQDSANKYKNIVTLTGSLVNNEPSDIAPLIDVTFGKAENMIANRKMFDKYFVRKDVKVHGIFNPKTEVHSKIINKKQLADLLRGKVHYMSHQDMEEDMPAKQEEVIRVPMSPMQKKLYYYSLNQLDAVTRAKIRHNIPVSQREMAGMFAELMQGRKVMTDPAALAENLQDKNPYEYSPKVRRVVDDLKTHLDESPGNKSVIYGNLIHNQLNAVSKALDEQGVPYTTYYGVGNEGNTSAKRSQNVQDYLSGKKRVLLISGAGGEGLDLKGSTMMQMLEGHYNPEKIQQAEARVRRLGDKHDRPILIKKYVSTVPSGGLQKMLKIFGAKPATSIDEYIYSTAKRKDDLNQDLRSVLEKNAIFASMMGQNLAGNINKLIDKREDVGIEAAVKQRLINERYPEYITKKHLNQITRMSGVDERLAAIKAGAWMLGLGGSEYLAHLAASSKLIPAGVRANPVAGGVVAFLTGAAIGIGAEQGPKRLLRKAVMTSSDIPRAIEAYNEKLDKKVLRKLKSSEAYLDEAERLRRMGLEQRLLEM